MYLGTYRGDIKQRIQNHIYIWYQYASPYAVVQSPNQTETSMPKNTWNTQHHNVISLKFKFKQADMWIGLPHFHTTGLLSHYPVLSPIWDGRQDNNSHHGMPISWLPLATRASKDPRLGSSEGLLWLGTRPYQDLVWRAYSRSMIEATRRLATKVSPTPFIKAKRQESLSV